MAKNRKLAKYRKTGAIRYFPEGIGLSFLVAMLFYRSAWGMIWALVVVPFWASIRLENAKRKQKSAIRSEFKEFLLMTSNSLLAGYSVERAFVQAESELEKMFGSRSVLKGEVHEMNQRIRLNETMEQAFYRFAVNTGLEEAVNLGEVLNFAKRSGGNYSKTIRETAVKIEESISVEQDIETLTAAKQLELKVMSFMPAGILLYISITSPEFVEPLYGNMMGIIIMSLCIVFYGLMIILGRKITQIDV